MPAAGHPHVVDWSDDIKIALLKKGVAEGVSYSEIARRIGDGCSRNAALGKAHRLGLTGGRRDSGQIASKINGARGRKKQAPSSPPRPPPAPPRGLAKEPKPRGPLVSLVELEPGMCRFPFGDPQEPSFGYCGEVTGDVVATYCTHCQAVAYVPPKATAKQLARSLRRYG